MDRYSSLTLTIFTSHQVFDFYITLEVQSLLPSTATVRVVLSSGSQRRAICVLESSEIDRDCRGWSLCLLEPQPPPAATHRDPGLDGRADCQDNAHTILTVLSNNSSSATFVRTPAQRPGYNSIVSHTPISHSQVAMATACPSFHPRIGPLERPLADSCKGRRFWFLKASWPRISLRGQAKPWFPKSTNR